MRPQGHTAPWRTATLLLALALLATVGARLGRAQEARAVTPPAGRAGADHTGDSLLGALSFSSSREPISVSANALDFDYRTRILTYRGDVVATQGDMTLHSDRLTVTLETDKEDRLKEVVAEGSVRLSKGTRSATAGRAVFDQTARTVVLSQDAVLHDGPNQVSGERVVVYLDEQRSVVEGGNGRVKAVLFPPANEGTPGREGGGP
jgi:lipopolysaccharide export system protein LptA